MGSFVRSNSCSYILLLEFLNSDSFIGVLQMCTIGVARIARHSKLGVHSSSFNTLGGLFVFSNGVCVCSMLDL
jgi:hypothetical protein